MEKENENVAEFCVDSSVIMDMYYLHKNNKQRIVSTLTRQRGSTDYVPKMYSLLKAEKIRLYVPYGVLGDLYYQQDEPYEEIQKFLEEHNFVNMSLVTFKNEELGRTSSLLSHRYCTALPEGHIEFLQKRINDKGVNLNLHRPAFEKNKMGKPNKYAKNMAECATAGLPFVTVNDQVYIKCNRVDLIEYTNRGVKGIDRDAKPISPDYMFILAENENKPKMSRKFKEALEALGTDLRSFEFKTFQEEMGMDL